MDVGGASLSGNHDRLVQGLEMVMVLSRARALVYPSTHLTCRLPTTEERGIFGSDHICQELRA